MAGPAADDDREEGPASRLTRRAYLCTTAVTGFGMLAGCGSDDGTITTSDPGSRTPTTATPTGTESWSLGDVLRRSPASHIAPADGFADVEWLDEVDPEVRRVTSLAGSGEGSLRDALRRPGARIIVFEVGGVIDLEKDHLSVGAGRCWIAGQTAPSPGITIIRGALVIEADNVVVQHVRVRPGDDLFGPTDAITNSGGRNVIVDHCSASWGTDETLSTNAGAGNPNISYTNNIVAEGLSDSIHPKGAHSMGSLIMDNSKRVTLAGNLWAHNVGRNPRLKGGTQSVVVNNMVYNFQRGLNMGGGVSAETAATIIGNHYRGGPLTEANTTVVGTTYTDASGPVRAYIASNEAEPPTIQVVSNATDIEQVTDRPLWPETLQTVLPEEAVGTVLTGGGARPADRSATDERILSEVRDGTGGVIDSQSEVGGYPSLESTERTLDVPDVDLAGWLSEFTTAVELGE